MSPTTHNTNTAHVRIGSRGVVLNRVPLGPTEFFYRTHDPTTVNRQGHDVGTRTQPLLFYPDRFSYLTSAPSHRARARSTWCL